MFGLNSGQGTDRLRLLRRSLRPRHAGIVTWFAIHCLTPIVLAHTRVHDSLPDTDRRTRGLNDRDSGFAIVRDQRSEIRDSSSDGAIPNPYRILIWQPRTIGDRHGRSIDDIIELYKKGVDRGLLREALKPTLDQRVRRLVELTRFAERLRDAEKKTAP